MIPAGPATGWLGVCVGWLRRRRGRQSRFEARRAGRVGRLGRATAAAAASGDAETVQYGPTGFRRRRGMARYRLSGWRFLRASPAGVRCGQCSGFGRAVRGAGRIRVLGSASAGADQAAEAETVQAGWGVGGALGCCGFGCRCSRFGFAGRDRHGLDRHGLGGPRCGKRGLGRFRLGRVGLRRVELRRVGLGGFGGGGVQQPAAGVGLLVGGQPDRRPTLGRFLARRVPTSRGFCRVGGWFGRQQTGPGCLRQRSSHRLGGFDGQGSPGPAAGRLFGGREWGLRRSSGRGHGLVADDRASLGLGGLGRDR